MAKVLSFEDIQQIDDLEAEPVEVAEWGGVLMIRPLTASEVEQIANDTKGKSGHAMNKAALALSCVEPALSAEKVNYLWTKSQKAITHIIEELARINGWAKEAGEEAKATFPGGPAQKAKV